MLLHGDWPTPRITAAPLELVGTSTWSCCYRGWEPLGGISSRTEVWGVPPTLAPGPWGPHGPGSIVFLLSLLIILAHSFSGRSPVPAPDLPIKPGVVWIYSCRAAFALTPHTLCPQVPCFLVSFPTSAGPQFPVWLLRPPSCALCPPFLLQPQGRGISVDSWASVISRDLECPDSLEWPCRN